MDFPRILKFNFDINGGYLIPDILTGRGDKIAISLYGNPIFYKPLCEANNIRLPYGLRSGLRPIENSLRIELKNTRFTNFYVSSATTTNLLTLSGLNIIDSSYTLLSGDLLLVKDQDNLEENGIYEVGLEIWRKLTIDLNSLFIIPRNGNINKNKGFRLKIIEKVILGYDPLIFLGPFSILKSPFYTDDEIEVAVNSYFLNKPYADLDWNNYGDTFSGYISGLYAGRLLVVPTIESCITWLNKYNKIIL